jgi:hypothetical protein
MLPLYHVVRPVPFSSFSLPVAYLLLFVFKPFWLIVEQGEEKKRSRCVTA